jgi:hypothetical protein
MKCKKIEVANESPILKRRRWLHVDKVTCWELVIEAQLMVDVASHCHIERNMDENNANEGSEQKHWDIWCDLSYLHFLQTESLPLDINEKKIMWIKNECKTIYGRKITCGSDR